MNGFCLPSRHCAWKGVGRGVCVYSAHYLTRLVESDGAGRGEGAWLDGNAVGWDMGDSWVWGFTWSMVMPRIEMGKK